MSKAGREQEEDGKKDILRASTTHNTILVSKLHYFDVVSTLKKCSCPTTTLNFTLKVIL